MQRIFLDKSATGGRLEMIVKHFTARLIHADFIIDGVSLVQLRWRPARTGPRDSAASTSSQGNSPPSETRRPPARSPPGTGGLADVKESITMFYAINADNDVTAFATYQKHSVRGFISTLPKKTGLVVTSIRRESDKARVYSAQ
jgi:hypothetical protein